MSPTVPPASDRLPFAFTGTVTVWDPIDRHLEIGARMFSVSSNVSVVGLTAGVHVTIGGYVERTDALSIVTRLVLDKG